MCKGRIPNELGMIRNHFYEVGMIPNNRKESS